MVTVYNGGSAFKNREKLFITSIHPAHICIIEQRIKSQYIQNNLPNLEQKTIITLFLLFKVLYTYSTMAVGFHTWF